MTATGDASPRYRRDRVTWAAFGALFGFGLLNAALGPALPFLRAELGLSYLVAVCHQVGFAVGGGTAGLLATGRRFRASRRTTIVAGLGAAGLAGLGIGYGPTPVVTIGAALLVSLCATSALISLWALLADRHARHRAVALSEGEIAVSLAGIATPTLVAALAASALGWRSTFIVTAVVALLAASAMLPVAIPPPAPATPASPGSSRTGPRRLPPTLLTILAVVALEWTLSFWLASYLTDDIAMDPDTAAATVAVLYSAHLAGRVATSRIARQLPARRLLGLALLVVLAGSPLLLAATAPGPAVAGIIVVGAGTGATFPLASALHVQASVRGSHGALGQTLAVAALGELTGPLLAGAIAQITDLRAGLLILPVFAVLAALSLLPRPPAHR